MLSPSLNKDFTYLLTYLTFAARIGDKYQIRLMRSVCFMDV